jgi:hypothetical protein
MPGKAPETSEFSRASATSQKVSLRHCWTRTGVHNIIFLQRADRRKPKRWGDDIGCLARSLVGGP